MTSGRSPLYELRNVRHAYGNRVVLDLPRLEIARGETLAILGPSGSGKTTLLRLLQFLEPPGGGEIYFDAERCEWPCPVARRRRVTTVFQRPLLLDRTVGENVRYGLRLRGRRNAGDEVAPLVDELGLTPLLGQRARLLSGGEAQRVALARALALQTEALLLDEPTANLDPANVEIIERVIRRQQAKAVTIVLVTHQAFQARRLATRTALLLEGRLVEIGETEAFFDSPRDERTRAFLRGEMVY